VKAFQDISQNTLDKIFLTRQAVMVEILRHNGSNNFALPHMHKQKLIKANALPLNVSIPFDVCQQHDLLPIGL
jgi:hypothetical protein